MFYNKKFKPGLDRLHLIQAQKAYGKLDVTDDENNTALHYAAFKNRKECVELLINTYSLAIDIRNSNGIMSKDMGALYKDIRDIIQNNYDTVDKNIASLAKGPTNPKAVKDLESQQLLKKSITQPMTKE